jgi:hypothetical protein
MRSSLAVVPLLSLLAAGRAEAASTTSCDASTVQLFLVGALPGVGAAAAHGVYLKRGERPPEPVDTLSYFAAALNLAVAITPVTSLLACDSQPITFVYAGSHLGLAVLDVGLAMWSSSLPRPRFLRRKEIALVPILDAGPQGSRAGAALGFRY